MAVSAVLSFFFLLCGHCEAKCPSVPQYRHKLLSNRYFFWASVRGARISVVVLSARKRSIGPDAVPDAVLAEEG